MCAKIKEKVDASIEGKLRALYELQIIDSKIDRIRTIRGELPLEVQDLEDSVAGLETRVTNLSDELKELQDQIIEKTEAIKDFKANIKKYEIVEKSQIDFSERKKDLKLKKSELDEIITETEKEEKELVKASEKAGEAIEDRLVNAYRRVRSNTRNGLAVVPVERDSCGGCFNKIPPQKQLDIKMNKKILVCEHCGRIMVDPNIISTEE